jgi:hypothetical protein
MDRVLIRYNGIIRGGIKHSLNLQKGFNSENIEKFCKLNVQGTNFLLPRANVENHDWAIRDMLPIARNIIETEGLAKVDDYIYLDCDAESFRMIYMLLNDRVKLENLHLTSIGANNLYATAKSLRCNKLLDKIQNDRLEKDNIIKQKDAEIKRLEKYLDDRQLFPFLPDGSLP